MKLFSLKANQYGTFWQHFINRGSCIQDIFLFWDGTLVVNQHIVVKIHENRICSKFTSLSLFSFKFWLPRRNPEFSQVFLLRFHNNFMNHPFSKNYRNLSKSPKTRPYQFQFKKYWNLKQRHILTKHWSNYGYYDAMIP